MAYRRSNGKGRKPRKVEPAVLTIPLIDIDAAAGTQQSYYIDISQIASIMNRRFYRQGINWPIAGFKFLTAPNSNAFITIEKISTTWCSSNAWQKAFSAWSKQQNEALDEAGGQSMKAAFSDFKIFMDTDHVLASFASNVLPFGFAPGTWEPSKIVLPNTVADASGSEVDPAQRFLHMGGDNVFGALSRGIIEGYADSRAYPQSPDPVGADVGDADNWMARMFDVGSDMEEVLDNATLRNDTLPYPQADYPYGETQGTALQTHDNEFISSTTVGGTTRFKGGMFPCGLIKITVTNLDAVEDFGSTLLIDLVPGAHRGYLCEPMTEM